MRSLLVPTFGAWAFASLLATCHATGLAVMTAKTQDDLASGFGNPGVGTIIMLQDIALGADWTVAGPQSARSKLFVLTRNLKLTVADDAHSPSAWYPTFDATAITSPRIYLPEGVTLTFDHIMFARLGAFSSITVGVNGFAMPYLYLNSSGALRLYNGVVIFPYCSPLKVAVRVWEGLPRAPLFPGAQSAQVLSAGWCSVPPPGSTFSGQCFADSYELLDVAWHVQSFAAILNNSNIAAALLQEHALNMIILCNQLLMSGQPTPPAQPALPARPPSPPAGAGAPASSYVGLAVGVSLGGAAALAALLATVVLCVRRRRRMRAAQAAASSDDDYAKSVVDGMHKFDDDVRKERDRYTAMLEASPGGAQDKPYTVVVCEASDGGPATPPPGGSGGGGSAGVRELLAAAKGAPAFEDSSADSCGVQSGAATPDLVDELHEMSRSMQTSIRDKQLNIQAVIGSGAYGTVYRGSWQGLPVAIKTLMFSSHTLGTGAGQSHSVLTEAALSKSISHPNVVATYSCDLQRVPTDPQGAHAISINDTADVVNDWRLYIIQEFCDGGSLYEVLRKASELPKAVVGHSNASGPFTLLNKATVFQLAFDIACGMSHLHERNVIHGDLNPANVLLKRNEKGRWTPKVCDFGLSVHLPDNRSHVSNLRRGTPFYVAPEVMQCGMMSRAADVFAMGVMLWELYSKRTVWQVSVSGSLEARPSFPHLPFVAPPAYAALVADCLRADAPLRPTFPAIMERLARLSDALPTTATQQASSSGAMIFMARADGRPVGQAAATGAADHGRPVGQAVAAAPGTADATAVAAASGHAAATVPAGPPRCDEPSRSVTGTCDPSSSVVGCSSLYTFSYSTPADGSAVAPAQLRDSNPGEAGVHYGSQSAAPKDDPAGGKV